MNLTKYFAKDKSNVYGYSFEYLKRIFDEGLYKDIKLHGCLLNSKIYLKCVKEYFYDNCGNKIKINKANDCFTIQRKLGIDNYTKCSDCHKAMINIYTKKE